MKRDTKRFCRIGPSPFACGIIHLFLFIVLGSGEAMAITTRVSVASDGTQGNMNSGRATYIPSVSADGRYVAFDSLASNLVPGDTNGVRDVFVHDQQTGQTTRVSVASDGSQGNMESLRPRISGDGRYVVFYSEASNLVAGDTNGSSDVFVHDRQTGQTTRVSVASDGSQVFMGGVEPSISADGRYVVFHSGASDLVTGDTNGVADIFVHDRQTGQTTRVSVDSAGNQANSLGFLPSINVDGRYVSFCSAASNLVAGDTNGTYDVFVHDRQTGQTTRVSVTSGGIEGNYASMFNSISADGRYVAFHSHANNLVAGDTNESSDVFVHDRQTGQTTRVSVDSVGNQSNGMSTIPSISADGRYVAFDSYANNLVAGDTNGLEDVFVHDRQTGQTIRVSVDSAGNQANGFSELPSISADGGYVAFESPATNLILGDTNGVPDIFLAQGWVTGDIDGDGIPDSSDNCPNASNPNQQDLDGDGIGDACDNCPTVYNWNQLDTNGNGIGDACEAVGIYYITASAGTNGRISPSGTNTIAGNEILTFYITPNSGFKVAIVLVDGASVGAVTSYTFNNVTADHTIHATFVANTTYSITASASGTGGGSISPSGATTVSSGGSQTYTITPSQGWHVLYVRVDGTNVGAPTSYVFSNVTMNHTIEVKFVPDTYIITATAGANGSISPAGQVTVNVGTTPTFYITAAAGYFVENVLVDGVSVGAMPSYTFPPVNAPHTISASYSAQPKFTITASAGANGSITPSGATLIPGGTSKTFTITPSPGYRVGNVQVDGTSYGARTSWYFRNVTANHTISATFIPDVFSITASVKSGNGSISPAGTITVNRGGSQTYTITPNAGWRVLIVWVDGYNLGALTQYTFTNVSYDRRIEVYFVTP